MGFEFFSNLNIFLFAVLLFGKSSFSQECDSNGVKCISCTDYQTCSTGTPVGVTVSCKSGGVCADDKLKECQIKLNCYALNECSEAGIFPDAMVESNFFVCLSDGGTGFLKYEFSCKDDSFFDSSVQSCISRSVTSPDPNSSSDNTTEQTDPVSSSGDPTYSSSTDSTIADPTSTDPTTTDPISTDPTTTDPTSTDPTSTDPTTTTTDPISTDPTTTDPTSTDPTTTTTTVPTSTDPTTTDPTSTDPTTTTTDPTSTDPTTTTTDPTSTDSTTTNPTAPTTINPTPPTTAPPTVCFMAGIFPLPDNCKMYYRCSTSLKPFYYICPGSSYFNEYVLKCSLIITPTCQEQILKNSTSTTTTTTTTTPKPTTTSTTTTTTTPKPTTTSTTTTTTTPKPTTTSTTSTVSTTTSTTTTAAPFTCPTSGTFENPSDCKTYYRCSTSGKIIRYTCPGNSYFNEFTKRCSLIVTSRCKNLLQGL